MNGRGHQRPDRHPQGGRPRHHRDLPAATRTTLATTSASFKQTVQKAATTTVLVSSATPVGVRPVGDVHGHRLGSSCRAAARPRGGSRSRTALPVGHVLAGGGRRHIHDLQARVATHSITAVYGGSTSYLAAPRRSSPRRSNQSPTSTTLVVIGNPSVYGQSVTFTATVTAASPGSGTPTGTRDLQRRHDRPRHRHPQRRPAKRRSPPPLDVGNALDHGDLRRRCQLLGQHPTLGQTVDQAATKTSLTSTPLSRCTASR